MSEQGGSPSGLTSNEAKEFHSAFMQGWTGFVAIAVVAHGVASFRQEQLNHEHASIRVGRWWDFVIAVLVPIQAVVLFVWWLVQARGWDPEGWLDPLGVTNVGTVLFQVGVVFVVLIAANRWLARDPGRSA